MIFYDGEWYLVLALTTDALAEAYYTAVVNSLRRSLRDLRYEIIFGYFGTPHKIYSYDEEPNSTVVCMACYKAHQEASESENFAFQRMMSDAAILAAKASDNTIVFKFAHSFFEPIYALLEAAADSREGLLNNISWDIPMIVYPSKYNCMIRVS